MFSRTFSVAAAPPGGAAWGFQDVSVPNAGQVEVTFDYTFSSSDIDMVVLGPFQTRRAPPLTSVQARG